MNLLFFGIFLLVVIAVWTFLKHLANGDSKEGGDAAVSEPSAANAVESSGEAEKAAPQQVVVVKSTPPGNIAAGIFVAVILLVVVMWVWGFFEAASDVQHGMNVFKYGMKVQNMNPITRNGYDTYMESFTDIGKHREQMRRIFE